MALLEYGSHPGRRLLLATVLASGAAFLDSTVVTVALPRLGSDIGANFAELQWVLDAYLLALGSLVLVGGALGDLLGRRAVFVVGLVGFALTSLACGLAPGPGWLIAARGAQGVAAALLVPTSLALLSASFPTEDRGRAIGAWSGLSGVSTAAGPFLGGWLVDSVSWRWIFLLNLPLVAAAVVLVLGLPVGARPEPRGEVPGARAALGRLDLAGAALTVSGLALVVLPLIEWGALGPARALGVLAVGSGLLAVFVVHEARTDAPMMPVELFSVRSFVVANAVTFAVYGALGGALFLLALTLQRGLGYSALEAGAATVPITVVLLALSSRVGALVPRVGARPLLTLGAVLTAAGLVLLRLVEPGVSYVSGVLPGVLVFALGLSLVVAPVTTTALADVEETRQGVASGVNNAVARIAGLVAVAVLPLVSGLAGTQAAGDDLVPALHRAVVVAGALCLVAAATAWLGLPARGVGGEVAGKPLRLRR